MNKKIVIVGSGVAGISTALKLVDNGYPGDLITIIDKGNNPYVRKPEEVMTGFAGAGGFSDGKLTYHTAIGGQLNKYCGDEKAYELMDQAIETWRRFHPDPSKIMCSDPQAEPDFIKPYFGLRLFPVWHIGTDYLHEIGKGWYDYLVSKGINFMWQTEVTDICFKDSVVYTSSDHFYYDKLIFGVGKSGIDLSKKLLEKHKIELEQKPAQIGVRFEAPQKYFQKLIDISYDFKLYRKDDRVSLRSFCTNNNAAYVAVEETYGNISYNGHAKKDEKYRNDMTNFGILMEIRGIENPFDWMREVVKKCQGEQFGTYYSPSRKPSMTSEGNLVSSHQIDNLDVFKDAFGDYATYVTDFIEDMNKIFNFGDDWGMYIPEVKYLTGEPIVDYSNLALKQYPDVHFVGDALSARGITVAGAQGIYVAEKLLK